MSWYPVFNCSGTASASHGQGLGCDHGTRAPRNPEDQFGLIRIAVEERGRKASSQWQDDACSRRLGILKGVPETVGERQRANINFYMLRDVRIRNASELTAGDVSDEFARVSQALGTGKTLLA